MFAPTYLVLMHTHVLNRHGENVTTAVTNMDVHDISRTACTYGLKRYFIVTPIQDQQLLLRRILEHWKTKASKEYHPDRVEALSKVELCTRFEEVKEAIRLDSGDLPEVVLTDARARDAMLSYADFRKKWRVQGSEKALKKPVLLVFGTGWGVSEVFYPEVHYFLEPVYGPAGPGTYNHLSVRAAAAVILDRLFGS